MAPPAGLFRIVIVGGGVSGLAAAYRIHQRQSILGRPTDLILLEGGERVGGLLKSRRQDGFLFETGADGFLTVKSRVLDLCREMGITRELIETQPDYRRAFVVSRGKLRPIPTGFYLIAPSRISPILMSPILTPKGKWRMLKEHWIPRTPQADETLGSFVRRRFGTELLDRLAQPIAGGIYGADPDKLGMRATFPQFLEMERMGGVLFALHQRKQAAEASGARYNLFASFRQGMQTLPDQLAERLGKVIRTGHEVHAMAPSGDPPVWKIQLTDGTVLEANAVCLAMASPFMSHIVRSFDPALAGTLASIGYSDCITMQFTFNLSDISHPLDGFGMVVPEIEKKSFSACTFMHRKYEGRAPGGMALLRVFIGGPTAARVWGLSDTDLQRKVYEDLKGLLGIARPPMLTILHRMRHSMPIYGLGHTEKIAQIDSRASQWPNLTLAGNWAGGVGVPDSIESGERAAERLLSTSLRY